MNESTNTEQPNQAPGTKPLLGGLVLGQTPFQDTLATVEREAASSPKNIGGDK